MNNNEEKTCNVCKNCEELCEGDYLCSEYAVIVMENDLPSYNYDYCNGRSFEAA